MTGPLAGIRVIDLTSMVSGPLATMTLGDQGADIIKVEAPGGGDHSRRVATRRGGFSASFINNNRNKRSLVIDLKQSTGLEVLKRLVAGADVLVQNFRPGVADRIGVGYDAMRAVNPNLVYASICGFGFEGPYASKPVFDPLIQAVSGLTTVQAGSDEVKPRLVRTILPDKLTAIQAAQAITAALFQRERSGKGQHVRLSMLDTVVSFLWSSDMNGHTFIGDEMEQEKAQSYIDLIYATRDGFVSIAVMQDKEWRAFAASMDRPDIAEDPRFATAALREENKEQRLELIQQVVRDFTSAEVLARLEAHDVPCAPVLRRRDMREHPQIAVNGVIIETAHPEAGRLRQARHPAHFSEAGFEIRYPAPAYGADTRQVLREAGLSDAELSVLESDGVIMTGDPT